MPPPPNTCTDYDGGIQIYSASYTTGLLNGQTYIDSDNCTNGIVKEYYCQSWNYRSNYTTQTCTYGCNATTNAACNQVPSCTNECSTLGQQTCSNFVVKTCGNYDNDVCLEWSSGEPCTYCNSAGTGCSQLNPNSCYDLDGGQNIYVNSSVYGWYNGPGYNYKDVCASPYNVTEFYCVPSGIYNLSMNITIPCPSGYQCVNGKCA
jgi:hypothetical protein